MKITRTLLFTAFLVLSLSGCSDLPEDESKYKQTGHLHFGKTYMFTTDEGVQCIVFNGSRKGGVDCNWEKYNKDQEAKLKAASKTCEQERDSALSHALPCVKTTHKSNE